MDPLATLHEFSRRKDLETAGLIAAVLAYGRVETIIRSVRELFGRMEHQPFTFITTVDYEFKCRVLHGFKHRFNTGEDIALFLQAIASVIGEYGTIEAFFTEMLKRSPPVTELSKPAEAGNGIAGAITAFSTTVKQRALAIAGILPGKFNFLIPSPATGSACKRMNMYLRWMVRPDDGIDLGVWKKIPAAQLIIPVDTHIAKIARKEGMTHRIVADWRMAKEITDYLRLIDPEDPVRFDFSLCRSGMIALRRDAA
jgi:uncharacterized protein (TIGR02757 family)